MRRHDASTTRPKLPGPERPELDGEAGIHVCEPGEVYACDDFVYWGFTGEGLGRLARLAGFARVEVLGAPTVDGHPRIIASLS